MATWPRDLDDLRAFCLVADLGSLTAAAKILGETKSAVSRRLTRLERTLGVTLVRRSPRAAKATESGLIYRASVGEILTKLEQAALSVRHATASPNGHLRVAAPHGTGVCLLAPLIARFVQMFPEIRVEMVLTDQPLDFDTHQIDLAIRPAPRLRDSSLIVYKLLAYELKFVAAPAYLEQYGLPQDPRELRRRNRLLLGGPQNAAGRVQLRLMAPGRKASGRGVPFRFDAAIFSPDNASVREAALTGGGIAVLPTVLVERDIRERRLLPLLERYVLRPIGSMYLLHPALRFVPPKTMALRDFLLQALAPRPPASLPAAPAATSATATREAD